MNRTVDLVMDIFMGRLAGIFSYLTQLYNFILSIAFDIHENVALHH